MNMKRIITAISAVAMLITSSLTATVSASDETRFPFPLEGLVDQNITASSTFAVAGAENVVYSFTFDSEGWADAKVRTADASNGTRSLRIRGTGTTSMSRGLGAEFTVKFGNPTADGQYVISFDLYREKSSDYDYAALNYDGWDGPARLTDTTKWAVTELGAGNSIGGVGTGSWSRYTATLLTFADDPQLNFAVANGGELHIDNIIVKDTSGNVLYAESFESDGPIIAVPEEPEIPDEPEEPEVIEGTRFPFPLEGLVDENITTASSYTVEGTENVVYRFTFEDKGSPDAKVRTADASDGTRSLRIRGSYTTSTSRGLGAEFTVKFGAPTADGQYVISFDLYRELSSDYDYVALNYDGWDGPARLTGTTKWAVTELGAGNSIGGTGTGSWSRYTATLLTFADDPQLNFAVANGGELHIDNIIVKDTSGNVLYAESFESDGPIIAVPEEPEIPDEPEEPEVIEGTRFPFPLEGLVDENITTASSYTVEGTENVVYRFTFEDKGSPDAKVRTADASDGTRSMRIRGSYTTSKSRGLGAEFTIKFGNPTADGKYVISFDLYRELSSDYDYATLNYDGWDGPARLTGTTKWTVTPLGAGNRIGGVGTGNWSRYTATTSTIADDPQLNFAVAKGGELHIDNIIVKDTQGNVLFAESFEAAGPIITGAEGVEYKIYDVELDVVEKDGDGYKTVETATKLKANTLLMSKLRIENFTYEEAVSAYVYTALFRDGNVIAADRQIVSVEAGSNAISNGVLSIPSLDDGEYTVNVYVWDAELNPIKDFKSLAE